MLTRQPVLIPPPPAANLRYPNASLLWLTHTHRLRRRFVQDHTVSVWIALAFALQLLMLFLPASLKECAVLRGLVVRKEGSGGTGEDQRSSTGASCRMLVPVEYLKYDTQQVFV